MTGHYEKVPKIWALDIPAGDKVVLYGVYTEREFRRGVRDADRAWSLTIGELARDCGCSARTIRYRLDRLERAGLIRRTWTTGPTGGVALYLGPNAPRVES